MEPDNASSKSSHLKVRHHTTRAQKPLSDMSRREACDRCHHSKAKCIFRADADVCQRCERSRNPCTVTRERRRRGRKPNLTLLGPNCEVQIWEHQKEKDAGAPAAEGTRGRDLPIMTAGTTQELPIVGAVDEAIEGLPIVSGEILEDLPNVASGTAGESLDVVGGTEELPLVVSGTTDLDLTVAERFMERYVVSIPSTLTFPQTGPSSIASYSDAMRDKRLRRIMVGKKDLHAALGRFLIGPSFASIFQKTYQYFCQWSPSLLVDCYLAILGALEWIQHQMSEFNPVDLRRGADSLYRLRSAIIKESRDAGAILILGQTLAFFDILRSGVGSRYIIRESLLMAKAWYPVLCTNPDLDTVTITPVFADTVDCLLRREIPIIRFEAQDRLIVDHYAGLCAMLLPQLYDLCVLSHHTRGHQPPVRSVDGLDAFSEVEREIGSWAPHLPSGFMTKYSPREATSMLVQARVYRTAALLVIHRLRYPLGEEDGVASAYARVILTDLANHFSTMMDDHSVRNTIFPLLIASVECREFGESVINGPHPFHVPASYGYRLLEFVDYIRAAKASGFKGLWYDLVEGAPEIAILP